METSKLIEVTDTNFKQELPDSEIPVPIDFRTPWSGPCLMAAPMLEKIAQMYKVD